MAIERKDPLSAPATGEQEGVDRPRGYHEPTPTGFSEELDFQWPRTNHSLECLAGERAGAQGIIGNCH